MIEAVNSVLVNASLLRNAAEPTDAARSFAAAPDRTQEVPAGPQAPFISPFIKVDLDFDTAVLQIRDSDTGDVLRQFPSESTLEARRRAENTQSLFASEETQDIGLSDGNTFRAEPGSTSSSGVSAEARVAAAALAASAQTGQVSTGAVSISA